MEFDIILPQSRIDAMAKAGLWPDRDILDYLDEAVAATPERTAIAGFNSVTGEHTRHTYAELRQLVDRVALGLVAIGVEPGDVVSYQLPNWWQFGVLHLACARVGAVTNPLMPIFRQRELGFMLPFVESKVMFVPASYRAFDYPAMIAELRPKLPSLEHVFVVCGDGPDAFEANFIDRHWEDEMDGAAILAERRGGPNEVTQVLYTSGTTGEPKGVMHTPNTLISNIVQYIDRVGLTSDDVILMASPLAHQTGFLYGLLMPIMLGTTAVLQDIWAPDEAVRNIEKHGVTFSMASTPFLSDLAATPAVDEHDISTLRAFLTAGAPIPRVLVEKASERLDIMVISCWGMTENGGVTTTKRGDSDEKIFGTDGTPLHGMETRVVDEDGKELPPGADGRLQARGMASFVGYLKRPNLFATDEDDWFETGDLAQIDADGYVRITGRSKDVIIRGGENIPVVEVEGLLYRNPAIQDAAIVAMPDERLGERACAFVTLEPGAALSFEDMVAFLEAEKMTRNYLPERLEIIDEMPRTPSGKIQKFKLREMLDELPAAAAR